MIYRVVFLIVWIAVCPVHALEILTPVYDSPPKYFVAEGEIKGLCIDVLKAIERIEPDIHFVLPIGVPLTRIEFGTRIGTYDLLLCASPTLDRISKLQMVDLPIFMVRDVLVVRAEDPISDATLDDIRKLPSDNVIIANAGTAQMEWLSKQEGLTMDNPAPNAAAAFRKLDYKRGRFIFVSEAVATNMMNLSMFKGKFRILPTPVRSLGRYFFFSKQVPVQVVERVEAAIKRLAHDGVLKNIVRHYVLK